MSQRKSVLLTTSREPSDKIRTFSNDIAHSIPNVVRVNRGKLSLDGVAEKALGLNADHIVIIDRWKHGFASIRFFQTGSASGLIPLPPLINVASVRFRREFETKTKPITSLIITMSSENSSAVRRLVQSLSGFFDIPVFAGRELISDFSAVMRVSASVSRGLQITFVLPSTLVEIGPRIDVSEVVWDERK